MSRLALPARREDVGTWGPYMSALPNDKWRDYAMYVCTHPWAHGLLAEAARAAGFCQNSTPAQTAKFAWKLSKDARMIAAIGQLSRQITRSGAPEAANALLAVIRNPDHKDHVRAIEMVMGRTDPIETRQKIDVVHRTVDPDQEALEELRALRQLGTTRDKLLELFGSNGLDRIERLEAADNAQRAEHARVIDGELVESLQAPANLPAASSPLASPEIAASGAPARAKSDSEDDF
jgi:hypothetical protein